MEVNFLLGAPKCGTTWLSEALKQHPEIVISNPKEPNMIGTHKGTFGRSEKEPDMRKYAGFFKGEGVRIDCSAHTLFCDFAPARVSENFPEAKFIICVREPVSRAESHWNMILDIGEDLEYGVNWDKFEDAWKDERFRTCCLYGKPLEKWVKEFEIDRFLIIESQMMYDEPQQVCDRVCEHLGVGEYKFDFSKIKKSNTGANRRKRTIFGRLLRKLVTSIPKPISSPLVNLVIKNGLDVYQLPILSKKGEGLRKKLNIDDVDIIREYVIEDVRSFEQLSGINTEIWTSEIRNGEGID